MGFMSRMRRDSMLTRITLKQPHRTRYCEIWDEKVSDAILSVDEYGTSIEARLSLQLINVYASSNPREIRAAYYRDGRMRVRPPHFTSAEWAPVLADAIRDPEWFTQEDAVLLLAAACERLGVAAPKLTSRRPSST